MPDLSPSGFGWSFSTVGAAVGVSLTVGTLVWQASGRDSVLQQTDAHVTTVERETGDHFTRLETDLASRRQDQRTRMESDERQLDTVKQALGEINVHLAHIDASQDVLLKSLTSIIARPAAR